MTNPSIWTPGQAVSAESSNRVQTFIASLGQTDFTITNFTYEVGTNSLEVDVSGVNQRPGIDFIETGSNSFSLTSPIEEIGTSVFVRGLVDVHGNPQVVSDASNVSYKTETVKTALDARLPEISSYADLRAYAGELTAVYVRCVASIFDGGAGVFRVDAADMTTADNGGTVLVDAVGRRWKREFSGVINVRWFGATGNGVTSDSAAVQAALTFGGSVGVRVYAPAGTYKLTSQLYLNSPVSSTGLIGDGPEKTRLVRAAAFGDVMQFWYCNGFEAAGFAIDGGYSSFPASASHGIAFHDSSNAVVENVKVTNYWASGIYMNCINDDYSIVNARAFRCDVDGGGVANNGILFVSMTNSVIDSCRVGNLDKNGNPSSALQFKNKSMFCKLVNSHAYKSRIGISFASDQMELGSYMNQAINCTTIDCVYGMYLGQVRNCTFDNILCNQGALNTNGAVTESASNLNPVVISTSSQYNRLTNIYGINVKSGTTIANTQGCVGFECADGYTTENNTIEFACVSHFGSIETLAEFDNVRILNNRVIVHRSASHALTYAGSLAVYKDIADSGNSVESSEYPNNYFYTTIASDAITLKNAYIKRVEINTEGSAATDNLSTINGGRDGQIIMLQSINSGRDITVKHGVGNIKLSGNTDFVLSKASRTLTLMRDTTADSGPVDAWIEVARGTAD